MTIQQIDVGFGKYTVVFDDATGKLSALRYGEPWRDLVGDNLIYWLSIELKKAREKIQEMYYGGN